MQHRLLGVRTFLGCTIAVLAVAAGSAHAAFTPQPAPVVTGVDAGGGPWVTAFDVGGCLHAASPYVGGCWLTGWLAEYDFSLGGVHPAVGDVTGDGRPDIVTVPGNGGRADVRVFDAAGNQLATAYAGANGSGRSLALGDVNGDGRLDEVLGNESWGSPNVLVLDGRTGKQIAFFGAFSDPEGKHGIRVAAGDVNGDGRAEIITANDAGLEPRVSVWAGVPSEFFPTPLRSFLAFDASVTSGVQVAAGDLDGDGRAEIVAFASTDQGPELRVFDGATGQLRATAFPLGSADPQSLRVTVGDVGGDSKPDLVVAGDTATGPRIEAVTSSGLPLFDIPGVERGESIAVGDATGDGRPDLVVGDGPGTASRITVFAAGGRLESSFSAYGASFTNGVRVAAGDFSGDGGTEYVAGQGPGGASQVDLLDRDGASLLTLHPFAAGTSDGVYVAAGDVDGDRHADLVVGADAGGEPRVSVYDRTGRLVSSFLAFEPGFRGGVRVAVGDVDGDGKAEIVAGSGPGRPAEVRIFTASGSVLRSIQPFDPFDTGGVNVAAGDLDGDGVADIAASARTPDGAVLRTFDGSGTALARIEPYGSGAAGEARVAIGDVFGGGRNALVTTPAAGWPATVDVFDVDGQFRGYFLTNTGFRGGLYVGVQEPLGPALHATAPPVVGVEGSTSRIFLVVQDPAGLDTEADVAARVRWGDGSGSPATVGRDARGVLVSAGHVFRRPGAYALEVRIVDRLRRVRILRTTAQVRSARLTVTGLRRAWTHSGVVATFRDGNPLARTTDFRARVDWGGGHGASAVVRRLAPGRFAVVAAHRFEQRGRHVVVIRVTESGGPSQSVRTILQY